MSADPLEVSRHRALAPVAHVTRAVLGVAFGLSLGLLAPRFVRADMPGPNTPPTPTPPSTTSGTTAATPAPSVTERVLAGITQVSPGSATITREARDLALSNLTVFASAGRAVPADLGDGVVGYRLFGIRAGSVFAALGLRNGDFLRSINGRTLSTPQEALAAYSGLRGASVWVLRVQRRGAEATLSVRVLDGPATAPSTATPDPAPTTGAAPASATTPARSRTRQSSSSMRATMAAEPH